MTDKQINKQCPHINFTDWGSYACKLYDPSIPSEKAFVGYGTCEANTYCPYKVDNRYKQVIEEIEKIAYRLRTKRDYNSPDEVNKDIDSILQKCEGYMNE